MFHIFIDSLVFLFFFFILVTKNMLQDLSSYLYPFSQGETGLLCIASLKITFPGPER